MFYVCNKYDISEGLVYASGDSWSRTHEAEGSIHTLFQKITDEKSLMKFAVKYGLPGISPEKEVTSKYFSLLQEEDMGIYNRQPNRRPADFVEDIVFESTIMRILRQAINDDPGVDPEGKQLRTDSLYYFPEIDSLLSKLARYQADDMRYISYYTNVGKLIIPKNGKYTSDQRKAVASALLSSKISKTSEQAYYDDDVKKVRSIRVFNNLITAIWYRFYICVVKESRDTKECPHCHIYHEGRGTFCTPDEFSKESPCKNAYHQKQLRERRKKQKETQKTGPS